MKKRHVVASLAYAGALAMMLGTSAASAADTVQLKLSHWLPTTHPLHKALTEWATSLDKESGGTLSSTIFPSAQLGKAKDQYDIARDGIADFAWYPIGGQPGRFPIAVASEIPFLTANAKGGTAAFDTWYRRYVAKEMPDVHYCFGFVIEPGGLHSRDETTKPAQLDGRKVRAVNGMSGELVRSLGGVNVLARAPQMRDLLDRGTIDIAPLTPGSAILFGVTKVTKHYLDVPFYTSAYVWVMNKSKYLNLTAEQKKAVDDHCTTEWAVKVTTPWSDFESAGLETLKKDPNHTVIEPTAEQLKPWRKAAAPLQKYWIEQVAKNSRVKIDAKAALQGYRQLLKENGAAY